MILARGRNMFSLSESYAVYGFFIGKKFTKNLTSKLGWTCRYQIWSIVNLLAIIAERAIKKESDSLPDGISHHTAQLLAIMADAVLRNDEVRSEILMFDQSQEEVNEKAEVKVDWSFVQDRHGVVFSSRAKSFVSALARYGEDDAAVFEKTVRIFKDELCKGIELEWGDEEDASDVLMDAKLHKLRDRYLRTLDRFVRQMEDYAASLGAGEVVKEWIEVGQELRKLRGIRVILKFDWEIQHQAHKVCHLINYAMSDTLAVHLMAANKPAELSAPAAVPALPAPAVGVSKADIKQEVSKMGAKLTRNINSGVNKMIRATNEPAPGQVPGKRGRAQSDIRCRQFEKAVLYKMTHEKCSRRKACDESFSFEKDGYTSFRSIEDYWREHPADADRVELMFKERHDSGENWEALQKEYGIAS